MARSMGLNLISFFMVAMVFIIGATEAKDYNVGDSFGWNTPTNESFYSDWASTQKFFVGDKLIFNWSGDHSVGFASEADYNNCKTTNVGPFRSNGNPIIFQVTLTRAGPYHFICTVDNHCERGQKFSINVESSSSNAPSSQPGSIPPTLSFQILSAFLSTLALYFFTCTN